MNVGRVVGPPGEGERGPAGLPGAPGRDGNTILSGPRPPAADDGVEGDFWIDLSTPGFSLHKRDGDGWALQADLRHIIKPGPVTAVGGGGGGGGGGHACWWLQHPHLPMTGLGRSADEEGKAGGISKPGGNIIPKAVDLKFQSNFNRWAVESLDALDEALPIGKVDTLPG